MSNTNTDNESVCQSPLIKNHPDLVITDENNEYIQISTIKMNNGEIEKVYNIYDDEYSKDNINMYPNILYLTGVGSVIPGTRVVYQNIDYLLLFGWHTNISNQTIYSWFLRPIETDGCDKTLYKEMIDEIDIIHFK